MSENLTLWQRYQAKKASVGGIYFTKEGAADLGVSEGALIATSPDAVYLGKDCRALLMRLHELGEVMAIVRNSLCVHEKMGVYQNVKLSETGGIALNFGGIDLRIFLSAWQHALAVENHDGDKISRSIQFYSAQGDAIQKVFLREESEAVVGAWQQLLADFRQDGAPEFGSEQSAEQTRKNELLPFAQQAEFQQAWRDLKDIHHFFDLLQRFDLTRQGAYRNAPAGAAVQLGQNVWQEVLEAARDSEFEIMLFAGSAGVVQIQTGQVFNVVRARGYLNVLDSKQTGFSMHFKDDEVAETWLTRRDTEDGGITCLEAFDADGKSVLQIFGKRKEGEREMAAWRELTDRYLQTA